MTSASILPSSGSSPPGFRSPPVPAHLRPSQPDVPDRQPSKPAPPVRQQGNSVGFPPSRSSGGAAPLSGASVVALQVQQGVQSQASDARQQTQQQGLSDAEQEEVARLKERDREVRAHEAAHATTGGAYTSAPSFEYVRGPDNVQYAVGGHVDIDVSEISGDPQATIAKLEVVQRAALAPARPSGQDRAVAAAAAVKVQEARAELAKNDREERDENLGIPEGNSSQTPSLSLTDTTENQNNNDTETFRPQAVNLNLLV